MTRFPNGLSTPAASIGILAVGEGASISKIAVYSPNVGTVTTIGANTTQERDFTVAGLLATDIIVAINKPTAQAGLGIVGMRVKAANTLSITYINATASAIVPTAEAYSVVAFSI